MIADIKITNSAEDIAVINIEGTIGMPEAWQFESEDERVATYERFRQNVEQIARLKSAQVIVNIRSTGGDVNDALLIFDALRSLNAKVTTRCFGYAASAATIIAQGASEGARELSSASLYLIHNSICTCEGNSIELQQKTLLLDQTDRCIAEIYAERSGRSTQDFLDMMSENSGQGRWLSPEQAIQNGLADRIIPDNEHLAQDKGKVQTALHRIGQRVNSFFRPEQESSKDGSAEAIRDAYDSMLREIEIGRMLDRARQAQDAAMPTATKQKEDPAVADFHFSSNRSAYEQDAKNIRK